MAGKCVHKGCGKTFSDPEEECVFHPGPPEFHEGQKGWKCCKPRVLTFDEFLAIPPCTTGKHSTVDDTPQPEPAVPKEPPPKPVDSLPTPAPRISQAQAPSARPAATPAPPESEDDDPSLPIPSGQTCRRRGCNETYSEGSNREVEKCVFHPGHPIFHEGSKG
ncbi:hypothetical protein LTS18_015028, partial [Coniosporium uncinatum]